MVITFRNGVDETIIKRVDKMEIDQMGIYHENICPVYLLEVPQ